MVVFRTMSRNGVRRALTGGVAIALAFSGVALGGCSARYMNYPTIGNDSAINDPNTAPMPRVVERALAAVFAKHPSGSPYVINFPEGLEYGKAVAIRDAVDGGRGELAALRVSGLPVYHVRTVWVRGTRARVEVLVPTGDETYDIATVRLSDVGIGAWRAEDVRLFPGGSVEAPALFVAVLFQLLH